MASWNYEIIGQTPIFRAIIGRALEGDEEQFNVQGEDMGNGFVRTAHCSTMLSGSIRTEYADGQSYVSDGFASGCPLHPQKQVALGGLATAVALEPIEYFCATAKPGLALDYHFVKRSYNRRVTHEIWVIAAEDDVVINDRVFSKGMIGHKTEGMLSIRGKAIIIWER